QDGKSSFQKEGGGVR
nr:RecName: Full=Fibrinogen alpha chain; Contains: RecName: Full=Fibrinopeptide A [Anas platyrhynchos]